MIGKEITHYRIIEKIGSGGMGEVYKAEDTKLRRTVAIKFLPMDLTRNGEARERFIQEAQAASALDHPNICTIHEIDQTAEGRMFIVMAYYQGTTLEEKIGVGELRIDEAMDIAYQVARGLAKAHGHGIVHRDIKPANVMVTHEGAVKILDFGLAKLRGVSKLTKESSTLGTVHYMSPEQALGKEVDHRSDLWSLGIVFYEMLAGRPPFSGEYEQAVIYSILNEEPPKVRSIRPEVPPELERIVERCLEKDPDKRYAYANEIIADLRTVQQMSVRTMQLNKKRPRRTPWIGIGAVLLAALIAAFLLLPPKATKEYAAKIQSIAVLPLQNFSHDPEQDYFADGMTEALITELSRIKALRVISRTSAMLYKQSAKSLPEIAKELRVDAILEGSALRVGDRIRITAQLIEAKSDRHVWAEEYERDFADVLSLQKEVSRAIAREIRVTLTPEEARQLSAVRKVNAGAHEAYLKGLYLINKFNQSDIRKGIAYFEEALRKDPDYALAYTGLAEAYDNLISMSSVRPREAMQKIKAYALKALSLDESLGEAHLMLADVTLLDEWDFAAAEREYKLALQLNPSYSTTYLWYSNFLDWMGRSEEAYSLIQQALQIDPVSTTVNSFLGFHFMQMRQYDEAIAQLKEVLDMEPNDAFSHSNLGYAYLGKKMMPEAIAELQKAAAGGMENAHVDEAYAWALSGKPDMARRMLADLLKKSQTGYVAPSLLFRLYYALGETDKALAWLEKSAMEREPAILFVQSIPFTERLRNDPRFIALLKKLGFKK